MGKRVIADQEPWRTMSRPTLGSIQISAIPRSRSRKIMSAIKTGLQAVRERIAAAARAASRSPDEIALVAVTKTFPAQAVAEAVECGQCAFGVNYAQEGVGKMHAMRELLG